MDLFHYSNALLCLALLTVLDTKTMNNEYGTHLSWLINDHFSPIRIILFYILFLLRVYERKQITSGENREKIDRENAVEYTQRCS